MPTSLLATDWRYLSALTPEELAEHLPMQQGLNELDTNCSMVWRNVTASGFELSCSFATDEVPEQLVVTGSMKPHEGKTLIVITPPRDTLYWSIIAVIFVAMTIGMMWAGMPIREKAPILWLMTPLLTIVLLGGFSFFYLRRWRMHRRTLEASLSGLLQAERVMVKG